MAKSKKSKILAMALCASVMAGIYASPVMANPYPYQDGLIISSGNIIEAKPIVEINGVRMTYGHLYVSNNIAADTLNINGTAFTVDKDGNAVSMGDVTSTTADGRTTYTLNTVGNNTSGITKSDGKVTTIEGAFSVNENGYIYNKNGSFRVTRDGAITASSYNGVTLATNGNQVLVGDIDVNDLYGRTEGIKRLGTNGASTTTIENTVSVDKWSLKVLDENGDMVASINSTTGGINAANGKFHVYREGQIEGTALSLMKNGAQNVLIDNSGTARFGAVDGNNVRIENGVLYVNRNNEQVAALSENGLTLTSSNNIRATLDAEQIANLNTTVKAGGVVDAKELNVTGATGGLYVKDVTNNDGVTGTMIYTKAADGKTNTMWIDPNTGNLNTVGSIGVGSNLAQPVTQINGIADANGDGIGDINVGISYNKDGSVAGKKINLDASTGNINLVDGAKVDGVDVSELSKNVGDIGADLGDNGRLGGITRTDEDNDNKLDTTTIEGTTSFDANGMRVTNENDGRAVAITKDRGIEVFGGNGASNAVITNNGTARFGAEGGANVRIKNGDVTSTYYDKDGNKGSYSLNTIGANTAGIERIQNSAGNDITEIEDTLRIYDNGTISTVNGAFRINEQGNVFANAVNVADGAVVISENSINAFGNQFTVNENGGVSTTGINVAKGMFTVSAGGVTMANNKLSVDLNGNIKAGTYNGVKIGMNGDGDIILGGTVIDDNFNSDNVAGITRKPSTPGNGNTTYIEQNTAISADGIVVTDPDSYVSTKTKYDGFYVKDKDGNNVSSLKDDGLMLTDQESGMQTLNATDIADIKGIDRVDIDNDGTLDTTVIEKTLAVSETGIAMSKGDMHLAVNEAAFAAVKGDNAIHLNKSGVNLSAGKDNFVSVTQDGIGLQGGTSQVIMNSNNGAVFRNGDKAVNGETVINGGMLTASKDIATTNADGSTKYTLNTVGTDLDALETTVGTDGRLGGIERVDTNNDGKKDTTVIEKTLTVSETGIAMSKGDMQLAVNGAGFAAVKGDSQINLNKYGINLTAGNNVISMTDAGIGFAGTVYTGNASDLHFTYDGYTGAGGKGIAAGNYTLDNLVDKVADIYDRTQGITYENGTTTVDGNLNVKGDATTGEGGNLDAGSGTIGDVTMSGGNINTDGVINAGGGGTIGGATVDEAGNINTDGVINAGGGGTIGGATVDKAGNINTDGVINAGGGGTIGGATVDEAGNINTKGVINAGSGTIGDVTMSEGKVTTGQTTVSKDGVSIADKTIISDHDVVINEGTADRVSLSETAERVGHLENRVGELEDRIDKVGAMAAAIANLRTMGYDPAAPTEVAVGIGQYRDETGAALGLFHYPNRDFMLSLSVSTSGDEVMGGIGATWKFGRKSPEKVAEIKKAQAEEAKLAKAEEMKQAAKEAKIKAQQERHAKLAAERAAQAEAAK